jgi:alkanesulfonate monooxygenase SsuD/methylene tetrahydromethanopterin reductase-like flavin-dependent oxidoreductase (luciferase family)
VRFGIILTGGTLDQIGDLAAAAETAGWDGVFYWDAVHIPGFGEMHDPWVALTVIALRTSRVRIGGIVMALPRHKPWLFARAATSVDHASDGRLVLPIGLGALDDTAFGGVGEATDTRTRGERMDEALAILEGLWTGDPFAFPGPHFRMAEMTFLPRPVQRPRIPIWLVGAWPRERSMQRVLRYDGILPNKLATEGGQQPVTPADVAAIRDYVRGRRGTLERFDIVVEGRTPGDDPRGAADIVRPWAQAGATWWTEAHWNAPFEVLHRRLVEGPPAIT